MKDEHITLRVTPAMKKRLDKEAEKQGRSRGNLITRILIKHFETKAK